MQYDTRNHIHVDHFTEDAVASIFTFFRDDKSPHKVVSKVPMQPCGEPGSSVNMPTSSITSSNNTANL